MRAFTLDGFDVQPSLRDDLPEPGAGDNDLLVRVRLEAGGLRVPLQQRYSLEQAGEALEAMQNAHTQGKLALEIG